jgi:hypothetical protein
LTRGSEKTTSIADELARSLEANMEMDTMKALSIADDLL